MLATAWLDHLVEEVAERKITVSSAVQLWEAKLVQSKALENSWDNGFGPSEFMLRLRGNYSQTDPEAPGDTFLSAMCIDAACLIDGPFFREVELQKLPKKRFCVSWIFTSASSATSPRVQSVPVLKVSVLPLHHLPCSSSLGIKLHLNA